MAIPLLYQNENNEDLSFRYKVNGGIFLFLPLVLLPFFSLNFRHYLYLIGFHLLFILFNFLLLVIGVRLFTPFVIIMDFSIRYFVPVLSMAYIPLLMLMRKQGVISLD